MSSSPQQRRSLATALNVLSLLVVGLVCWPKPVEAHPFSPLLVELVEQAGGEVTLTRKLSVRTGEASTVDPVTAFVELQVALPASCTQIGVVQRLDTEAAYIDRARFDCGPGGLAGELVAVPELAAQGYNAVLRYTPPGGDPTGYLLDNGRPAVSIPEAGATSAFGETVGAYVGLGVEHILGGIDHLLFIACLVFLVRRRGPLVWAITGFTLAHSATLGLAVLDVVRVPGPPVEAVIALSILLLAGEVARRDGAVTLARRAPWLVAMVFGLVHGLGFAGALHEAGLPPGQVPAGLLGFNLGVELGQLMVVVPLALALIPVRRWRSGEVVLRWAVYPIGVVAAYWMFERLVIAFG